MEMYVAARTESSFYSCPLDSSRDSAKGSVVGKGLSGGKEARKEKEDRNVEGIECQIWRRQGRGGKKGRVFGPGEVKSPARRAERLLVNFGKRIQEKLLVL